MDQVQGLGRADEPLHSEPTLAAEVAASTRSKVLRWAASWCRIAQVSPTWDRKTAMTCSLRPVPSQPVSPAHDRG
jgi:hypothetical protein